ncbi:FliI/YscN family ATPase [Xanthomonas citri]|uniref:FliI/YscN family ATPase n=1 Tax=Xanthomonas citri TaxID=346 RepID=UPI000247CEB6|nr:FliI/YscN family ATPase [Xanthomonas citri]MBE0317109.1 FliI/YscN family ATPase [Xanthomonas citri pv. punicae]MDS0759445.1 FliI/YscN family ATPase [Xanthomonas citri pv. punicae]MDS0763221.1 FliI/YscN family ATPase [Xanthomonas citri pv. punicae]MDS0797992.1 FliI/YscN family ATPase [Xanthomonas citri pv. punicae]MDS0830624.1 FliI/YscN family ATPase [Xanthomonas citri pv. punicae]
MSLSQHLTTAIQTARYVRRYGRVCAFNGLVIEADGPDARVGDLCEVVMAADDRRVDAQVVGLRDGKLLLMPYGEIAGLAPGARVETTTRSLDVPVGHALLGRVVDAFSRPLDALGACVLDRRYPLHAAPPNPLERRDITEILETGVHAVDGLLTLGKGQRVGIFAGSGVGKSTLLGMFVRHVKADVIVLALVGERGREVGDFVRHTLGSETMKRCVVMAATADQPALVRTHAVHAAHAVAEFFRDQGKSVLLVVDSMTRFAMAQREIGLTSGEPPTFRGYTPSVFAWLPRIAERCGNFQGGAITAIYSVLVEGDDLNEPITDHMRAILDGHIVLDRRLASKGQYPAINVLASVSRLLTQLATRGDVDVAARVRRVLAILEDSRDLVELGAYQSGANPALDQALEAWPQVEAVLKQAGLPPMTRVQTLQTLQRALPLEEAHV